MSAKKTNPSSQNDSAIDSLDYEEALNQLQEIINSLEIGEQTLDQSLALFERGQALARRCSYLLDQAELKIKMLSGEDLADFEPEN